MINFGNSEWINIELFCFIFINFHKQIFHIEILFFTVSGFNFQFHNFFAVFISEKILKIYSICIYRIFSLFTFFFLLQVTGSSLQLSVSNFRFLFCFQIHETYNKRRLRQFNSSNVMLHCKTKNTQLQNLD